MPLPSKQRDIALADTPNRSTSSSTASLGAVPDDIKYLIIERLPDFHSLQSLARALKPFKKLYELDRKRILVSFLARTMNEEVRSDALMALRSSMMMAVAASCDMRHPSSISSRAPDAGKPRLAEIEHFMENYIKAPPPLELREFLPKGIPLAAVDRLASLHGAVQFLTTDFCAWMEENQSMQKQEQKRIQFAQPLSASETVRIHRAFYRIETFGNLFRERIFKRRGEDCWYEDWDHLLFLHREAKPHPFFKAFDAWEIEEIACIRDYMHSRLSPRFETIEPAFSYKLFPGICQWSGVNNHHFEEFRFDIPGCVVDYSDNRIERGLEHFSRILVAASLSELTELLVARLYTTDELHRMTLSDSLCAKNTPYSDYYEDGDEDPDEEEENEEEWRQGVEKGFAFKGDEDLSSPNLAYAKVVAKTFPPNRNASSQNIYYEWGEEEMRGVGYCFWDAARLEDWEPWKDRI